MRGSFQRNSLFWKIALTETPHSCHQNLQTFKVIRETSVTKKYRQQIQQEIWVLLCSLPVCVSLLLLRRAGKWRGRGVTDGAEKPLLLGHQTRPFPPGQSCVFGSRNTSSLTVDPWQERSKVCLLQGSGQGGLQNLGTVVWGGTVGGTARSISHGCSLWPDLVCPSMGHRAALAPQFPG